MNRLASFVLPVLLALAFPPLARAQALRPATVDEDLCHQERQSPAAAAPHVLLAVVCHIDHRTHHVTLGTTLGTLEVSATADILRELHEGDVITVTVAEDGAAAAAAASLSLSQRGAGRLQLAQARLSAPAPPHRHEALSRQFDC